MPKPPPGHEPDPMARVVDRLLAQLPGLQAEPVFSPTPGQSPAVIATGSTTRRRQEPTQGHLIGVWIRTTLALSLGVMMVAWPYSQVCGFPLFGYLSAVATVMLSGMWAATAAWRYRSSLAHVVSLILVLYGMMLSIAELLPRTGYAAHQAAWSCENSP